MIIEILSGAVNIEGPGHVRNSAEALVSFLDARHSHHFANQGITLIPS
jgi:hypothetical protein